MYSGCLRVRQTKRKAEGQQHIQVSLLRRQLSLSSKTTSDLPTAATKNFPMSKLKINIHLSADGGTEKRVTHGGKANKKRQNKKVIS